jgi:hypothetical protein
MNGVVEDARKAFAAIGAAPPESFGGSRATESLMSVSVESMGLDPVRFDFGDHEHRSQAEGIGALVKRPSVAAFVGDLIDRGFDAATAAVVATPKAAEVAIAYAMIKAVRAFHAYSRGSDGDEKLFTAEWPAARFAAALDAVSAWQARLKTDAASETCVDFELQCIYHSVASAFESCGVGATCVKIHRIVSLVESQDAEFKGQIRAYRGMCRLARMTRDADVAMAIPTSFKTWNARKRGMHSLLEIMRAEHDREVALPPMIVTGRIHDWNEEEELYRESLPSVMLCGIRPEQAFTSKVSDTELRIAHALRPEFWMSVSLPELLKRVPKRLLRDELAVRKRDAAVRRRC